MRSLYRVRMRGALHTYTTRSARMTGPRAGRLGWPRAGGGDAIVGRKAIAIEEMLERLRRLECVVVCPIQLVFRRRSRDTTTPLTARRGKPKGRMRRNLLRSQRAQHNDRSRTLGRKYFDPDTFVVSRKTKISSHVERQPCNDSQRRGVFASFSCYPEGINI